MSLTLTCEDTLIYQLQTLAEQNHTTLEDVMRRALIDYVRLAKLETSKSQYSFIGIGHSGKQNLSLQVDDILEEAANRKEGWSLS